MDEDEERGRNIFNYIYIFGLNFRKEKKNPHKFIFCFPQ
jgi:hypothetical protein